MADSRKPEAGKMAEKKPYQSPKLSRYGAVKQVTAGGSGVLPEGGQGMSMNRMKFP